MRSRMTSPNDVALTALTEEVRRMRTEMKSQSMASASRYQHGGFGRLGPSTDPRLREIH